MKHLKSSFIKSTCLKIGDGVVRGYDAVALVTSESDLEHPERMHSTNMRKYMATMTQVYEEICSTFMS